MPRRFLEPIFWWRLAFSHCDIKFLFPGDLLVSKPAREVQARLRGVEERRWEVSSCRGAHGWPETGSPTSPPWSSQSRTSPSLGPPPPPPPAPSPPSPALDGPPPHSCFDGGSSSPPTTAAAVSANEKPGTGGQPSNQSWGFRLEEEFTSVLKKQHQWRRRKSSKASVARLVAKCHLRGYMYPDACRVDVIIWKYTFSNAYMCTRMICAIVYVGKIGNQLSKCSRPNWPTWENWGVRSTTRWWWTCQTWSTLLASCTYIYVDILLRVYTYMNLSNMINTVYYVSCCKQHIWRYCTFLVE